MIHFYDYLVMERTIRAPSGDSPIHSSCSDTQSFKSQGSDVYCHCLRCPETGL